MIAAVCAGAVALGAAVMVVRSANLIRAVLWLGASLLATAALYVTLDASFLAAVQVLVYVGGVVTLMIFGVMMTRRHESLEAPAERRGGALGAVVAGGLFAVLAWAIRTTPGLDGPRPAEAVDTAALGHGLLVDHVLAFEALSVLLLGAIVGAIVIARRRAPGEVARGFVAPDDPARPAAPEVSP